MKHHFVHPPSHPGGMEIQEEGCMGTGEEALSSMTETSALGVLPLEGNLFMVQPEVPAYADFN